MDKSNNCMHIDSILEDFKEGCLICTQCCRVLEMNIPFQNLEDLQIPASAPDKVFTFIYDSCHRMNIPNSVIDGINDQYRKYKKSQSFHGVSYETLAAYSIYYHLKQENIGKPIEMIARFTGVDSHDIWRCEFNDPYIPSPIGIESLVRRIYRYLDLKEKDCQNILKLSNHFEDSNFSPITLAATLTWSYCKIKKMNVSLAYVRSLYQCCHMSIYRCRKFVTLDRVKHILDM